MRFSILAILCFFFAITMAATVHNTESSPSQVNAMNIDLSYSLSSAPAVQSPSEFSGRLEKRRARTAFLEVPILSSGTLFYVALSVSTLLWCTGKGIDMTVDRQERMAESAAY
ncbi:hypothetical protein CLU79DRAFT_763081 [Phycomyces nitens]|nr:hypothetical protein CLU79DRAFT_763081 [Phycomyces nitens]